jgi:hypothetical protein
MSQFIAHLSLTLHNGILSRRQSGHLFEHAMEVISAHARLPGKDVEDRDILRSLNDAAGLTLAVYCSANVGRSGWQRLQGLKPACSASLRVL